MNISVKLSKMVGNDQESNQIVPGSSHTKFRIARTPITDVCELLSIWSGTIILVTLGTF